VLPSLATLLLLKKLLFILNKAEVKVMLSQLLGHYTNTQIAEEVMTGYQHC